MKMCFKYFVSYYCTTKNGDIIGNCEVGLNGKISSYEDIELIQNKLKENKSIIDVIILNWKELE